MYKSLYIILFLFAASGVQAQQLPERSLVRKGNRQYNKGNYEQSAGRYEQALQAAPGQFEAIYNLGNALYKAERFDRAEQTMQQAAADSLRADTERAEAFYNLGNAQFKQQKYQEALESYKQSLRLNPSDMEAKYNYAYTKRLLDENKDGGGGGGEGDVTISGNAKIENAQGGDTGSGIGGGFNGNGDVTISGNAKIENATGGNYSAGIGGGRFRDATIEITGDAVIKNATGGDYGAGIGGGDYGKGDVTISGNAKIENAQGGYTGSGIGGGSGGLADVAIEGNATVNATGGDYGAGIGGGADARNDKDGNGNQITIKGNENGSPTINAVGGGTNKENQVFIGGAGIGSGVGDATAEITLEGKVTIVAKGGEGNVAIGANGIEQEFSGLAEGSSITRYDSEGNNITLPTDPVPAVPSSSGGGSADASVQESVFPGLVVTDKDGQHISYTSIRGNNVLSLRVGRFTASLRASLATLRQLRAEGIDTITFQTILCSTTLSVDELLAMGGEDAEAVLTHRLTASSLTVG